MPFFLKDSKTCEEGAGQFLLCLTQTCSNTSIFLKSDILKIRYKSLNPTYILLHLLQKYLLTSLLKKCHASRTLLGLRDYRKSEQQDKDFFCPMTLAIILKFTKGKQVH